jgi:hypothetical protein
MANKVYPKFKEVCLDVVIGSAADPGGTLKAALIDTGVYTYNDAHDFWNDASAGVIGTPVAISSPTFTNGILDGGDVTFTAVSGSSVEALIVFLDTGTPTTSRLVCYLDTGVTGLPFTPSGGDVQITWDNGSNKIFAL